MKKLLVLALVLSMATMASAALQISVNGVANGTATLNSVLNETATLSIATDSIIGYGLGDWAGAALVVSAANASLTGGVVVPTTEPGLAIFADAAADLSFIVPTDPAEKGLGFMILFTGANMNAGTVLFDSMVYTALAGAGDFTVTLWGSQDYVDYTNLGSVTITQIVPEPMTMGLLGLGGLFLRRRSK